MPPRPSHFDFQISDAAATFAVDPALTRVITQDVCEIANRLGSQCLEMSKQSEGTLPCQSSLMWVGGLRSSARTAPARR